MHWLKVFGKKKKNVDYTFLGNCPLTPPLSQHFALSDKKVLMLAWGRSRWAVSRKRLILQIGSAVSVSDWRTEKKKKFNLLIACPSLKFIRLLRVVFSSQQRLNRRAVYAVQ